MNNLEQDILHKLEHVLRSIDLLFRRRYLLLDKYSSKLLVGNWIDWGMVVCLLSSH